MVIKLYDVTLRDGNHALRHQLSPQFVSEYCAIMDSTETWAVEVGHGNGLGASSFLVGKSRFSDEELLVAARNSLNKVKLAVHIIPGFATVQRDIIPAIDIGVDIYRVATHCTEATAAQSHIEFLSERGMTVHGVLMMSHSISASEIVKQARLMNQYGASAVILMDSAGNLLPSAVTDRIKILQEDSIFSGFHAHNNLAMAVANALEALKSGARILDGSIMGLGAGAGNAQLECLVSNIAREFSLPLSIDPYLELSQLVEGTFADYLPKTNALSIESGNSGVFSGYAPHVMSAADEFRIPRRVLWKEIGQRKLVAGQETVIREIAQDLSNL